MDHPFLLLLHISHTGMNWFCSAFFGFCNGGFTENVSSYWVGSPLSTIPGLPGWICEQESTSFSRGLPRLVQPCSCLNCSSVEHRSFYIQSCFPIQRGQLTPAWLKDRASIEIEAASTSGVVLFTQCRCNYPRQQIWTSLPGDSRVFPAASMLSNDPGQVPW